MAADDLRRGDLPHLALLDLRDNRLTARALEPLLREISGGARFPRLERVLLRGNPAAEQLRATALAPHVRRVLVLE